ncbi:MAG: hypothetical protein JRJ09_13275 [Deltaproteobacteria bacterium]|nr:hypothetical protein [Deltaproteobacteria bacterium]
MERETGTVRRAVTGPITNASTKLTSVIRQVTSNPRISGPETRDPSLLKKKYFGIRYHCQ